MARASEAGTDYVELPTGIFTADGVWFHTREALIEEFAPGLFDHRPLRRLLGDATVWLRLPVTLTAWLLPVYLLAIEPVPAALAALATWFFVAVLSPSVVLVTPIGVLRRLAHPIAQGVFYVMVLSYLASGDEFAAVGVGIGGFVALRWGLLDRFLLPVVRLLPVPGPGLPRPDRILRNLIVRTALGMDVELAETARMEERMLEIWNRRRAHGK